MAKEAAELLVEALKLSPSARAALADSLIESLDGDLDEDAEECWKAEIENRLQQLDSGAVQTLGWDVVRHNIRNQLPE